MGLKFNPFTGNFDTVVDQASDTNYDNSTSGLTATDVNAAIDEVDGNLDNHLDGGSNKHDADEIDYERADGSKKNIQAGSDDLEASTTDLDDAIGSLATSPTNYTPSSATIVASHLAGIDAALGAASGGSFEWQDSVIDKDLTAPPGGESTGDRYLLGLDTAGSAMTGAWATHDGEIAEYNGSGWDFTTPTTGTFIAADDETDRLYLFGSTTWTAKYFEATTASGFLSKSGFDIQLTNLSDGNVIVGSAGNVATSVNTGSLGDVDADTVAGLTIKAGAVDNSHIAAAAGIEFSKMEALTAGRMLRSDGTGEVAVTGASIDASDQISGVARLDVDNLRMDGNALSITNTDGNLTLSANGTGIIDLSSHAVNIDSGNIDGVDINLGTASDTSKLVLSKNTFTNLDGLTKEEASLYYATDDDLPYMDDGTNLIPVEAMRNVALAGPATAAMATRYLVDTSASRTITLPTARDNFYFEVKDVTGSANANNITIARAGSESIEGVAANYTINSDNLNTRFVSDGTDWWIV